jgi:26S proteasome regulatory subunit N7
MDWDTKTKLMNVITEKQAAPMYDMVCKDLKWSVDKESMVILDAAITDAEENFGDIELRDALLKKSEFLAQIGDKDADAVRKTAEKTVGLGNRMDLVFLIIRIGLFFTDHNIIKTNIANAHQMLKEGGTGRG